MFWWQKAEILCNTQQRTNQLQSNITTYLAGKATRYVDINQDANSSYPRPSLVIQVEYSSKVDADAVWADVKDAQNRGWIVSGFAAYAEMTDDRVVSQLIERIEL